MPKEVFKEFFERHVDFVGELDSQLSRHSLSHQAISRDLLVRGSCPSGQRVCVWRAKAVGSLRAIRLPQWS